jgi:hypothetical protein
LGFPTSYADTAVHRYAFLIVVGASAYTGDLYPYTATSPGTTVTIYLGAIKVEEGSTISLWSGPSSAGGTAIDFALPHVNKTLPRIGGNISYSQQSSEYAGNFDSSGNLKSSTAFRSKVPNSIANLTSNITAQFYSVASGSLVVWFTSTLPTSKSPGGTGYPDWEYPDGSGGIYPGYINGYSTVNGTGSSAPGRKAGGSLSWTGLGTTNYILIGYDPVADYYTVPYGPSATPPTDDVIATAQGDGNVLVTLVAASSTTVVHAGGGGGQPVGGGGGKQRL